MSSQHKLYNYEVSPPAEVWKQIEQELEDVNGYRKVSNKLQNLQAVPPAFAWDKISGELDDQQSYSIIANKLSGISVAPPAEMWHRIKGELDMHLPAIKKEAPVIPLRKRITRYAVAAATVGILILVANLMIQRSEKDVDVITQTFAENSSPAPDKAAIATKAQAMQLAQTTANLDANSQMSSTGTITPTDGYVTTNNGNMYTTTVEKNREMDGRYIVLMTGDGNVVRMNKKVSNMADCISGEVETQECNNQIAEWQEELANIPVFASPDNILGLLELATKEPATAGL